MATRREKMEKETCKKPKAFCKNVEDKYYELKTRTARLEEGLKSAIYALEKIGIDEPDLWSKRVKGHMTIDSLLSELHCLINSDR